MSQIAKILFWVAGICLLMLGLGIYFLKAWIPFFWILIAFIALSIGGAIFKEFRFFKEFFAMKTTKQGMSMGALILLVVGFLIVINFLSVRHYKTLDFSIGKSNTLSEQSVNLLKSLDSDLKVLFFYKIGVEGVEENRKAFRELIKKYQDYSSKVQLEFVEMNERPDLVSKYEVNKGSGVVFLDYKGRKNRIEKIDEQEITSALLKVTREKEKVIYYLVGHGERSLEEAKQAEGMNALKLMLENNRYFVKELALSQYPDIPKDADMLMVIGPTQGLLEIEIKSILKYLEDGGSLFLAIKPLINANLDKLYAELGLKVRNHVVLNYMEYGGQAAVDPANPTLGTQFSLNHPITKPFMPKDFMLFRFPTSILIDPKLPEGISVEELVSTNKNTIAFKDMQFKNQDSVGPFTIGVALEKKSKDKKGLAIIIGDVEFISNQMIYQNLNRDLLLNSLAWLSKEENLISITPKETQTTKILMTETKLGIFIWAFAIPLPLLLLFIAVTLKIRRRNS